MPFARRSVQTIAFATCNTLLGTIRLMLMRLMLLLMMPLMALRDERVATGVGRLCGGQRWVKGSNFPRRREFRQRFTEHTTTSSRALFTAR